MREIKFRAWDKEQNKYVYDFWDIPYFAHRVICHYNADMCEQYTGMKDRLGTEIYENDLIMIIDPYTRKEAKGTATVVFSYEYVGGWVAGIDGKEYLNLGTRQDQIRVVGNTREGIKTEDQE